MVSNLILQLKVNKTKAEQIKNSVLSGNIKYVPYLNQRVSGIEPNISSSLIRPSPGANISCGAIEINRNQEYDDTLIRDHKTICPNQVKDWPQRTNLRCWYCGLHFDSRPVKMPYKYDESTDTFHVYGCFCSFNCVMKKNEIETGNLHKDKIYSLIHLLYKKLYGDIKYINPSPNKELLQEYGGDLTQEQYKYMITENIESSKVLLPPIVDIGYSAGLQNLPDTKRNQSLGNMLGYSLGSGSIINSFESSSVMNNFIKFN